MYCLWRKCSRATCLIELMKSCLGLQEWVSMLRAENTLS